MRAFVRRRGVYIAELDATERTILAGVIADTATLLGDPLRQQDGEQAEGAEDEADSARPGDGGPHPPHPWSGEEVAAPTDPALARLLPSASEEDDDVAAEFRRLTQEDLRTEKARRLRMVWAALRAPGTKLTVQPDQAMDWAAALTDVRLVVSERLGIRTDSDAEAVYAASAVAEADLSEEEEIRLALSSVYSALTWLQESLVQVMLPALEE